MLRKLLKGENYFGKYGRWLTKQMSPVPIYHRLARFGGDIGPNDLAVSTKQAVVTNFSPSTNYFLTL